MKIIHLIGGLRSGGAEHMVLELARIGNMDDRLQMSTVVLTEIDEIGFKFKEAGIKLFRPARLGPLDNSFVQRLSGINKCIRHCIAERPDVIHAHLFHAAVVAVIVRAFIPSTKIVFSLHSSNLTGLFRRVMLWSTSFCRDIDIMFPRQIPSWYQKKSIATVGNGVDITRYSHSYRKHEVFTFLFVGRLENVKNPMFLVKLAKELRGDSHFQISIIGSGALKIQLLREVARNQLQQYFKFETFSSEIPESLGRCHCLVLPSRWEGMPLILLEAGAAGLPVLASPQANFSGILDAHNGYLAELHEMPLVAKEIMENYDEALLKAKRLQQVVRDNFTIKHVYSAFDKTYWSLMG